MTDTSHTLLISRQHWPLFVVYSVLSYDKINFSYMQRDPTRIGVL